MGADGASQSFLSFGPLTRNNLFAMGGQEQSPIPSRKPKQNARRRSTPPLPPAMRKEIAGLARELNLQHRKVLMADPNLKDRVARFLRSLLLPRPRRRGRPRRPDVTQAIRLLRRFRRQYPGERHDQTWDRICPEVIPNYASMTEIAKADVRAELIARVKDRLKKQNRHGRTECQGN
jgi:hypothetical protein